jgi:hypothetical protein
MGPSYNGVLQNDNRTQTVNASGATTFSMAQSASWGNAAGGEWCDNANWAGAAQPNNWGTTATFGTIGATSAVSINVTGPERVGTMQFNSAATQYTIGGSSSFVMLAVGGASVNVRAGTQAISAAMVMGTTTTFNVSSGACCHVTNLQSTGVGFTKSGSGVLQMAGMSVGSVSVTAGTLQFDAGVEAARRVSSLTVIPEAKLDVSDGKLVVAGGSVSALGALVKAGTVTTSMPAAASGGLTGIGVATASDTGRAGGTFAGVSVSASDVLVMYTYRGDANLDGKINVDDYGRIDLNVGTGNSGWSNGDFNYDGKINVDDYAIIDFNIGMQGAPFATTGGVTSVMLSAVPEPSSALVFSSACVLVARARRNRRG